MRYNGTYKSPSLVVLAFDATFLPYKVACNVAQEGDVCKRNIMETRDSTSRQFVRKTHEGEALVGARLILLK